MGLLDGAHSASELLGSLKDRFTTRADAGQGAAEDEYFDEEAFYAEGYESYAPSDADIESERYNIRYPGLVTSGDIRSSYGSSDRGLFSDSSHSSSYGEGRYASPRERLETSMAGRSAYGASGEVSQGREYVGDLKEFISPYQQRQEAAAAAAAVTSQPTTAYSAAAPSATTHHDRYDAAIAQDTPVTAAASVSEKTATRRSGLDSLFSSTTPAPAASGSSLAAGVQSSHTSAADVSMGDVAVVKPVTYDDVSDVARQLKAGKVVVLNLKHTESGLTKRLLDFSFGVACALDAQVECMADKMFLISTSSDFTLEERHRIRQLASQ